MAEFILKHPYPNPPAWARIEKETVKWIKAVGEATPFPTEAEALKAFGEAKKSMLAKGEAKLKRDLAAGKTIKNERYYYSSQKTRAPKLEDCVPQWLLNGRFKPVTESRSTDDDLLGVMELWFVKGPGGWLREGKERRTEFSESFHGAKPFLSLEAAKASLSGYHYNCCFIRGSMAFSQVVHEGGSLDEQAQGIAAACEAREIGAEIQAAATARLADMKSAAPRVKSRL